MSFRSRLESALDLLGLLGFTVRDSAHFKKSQEELAQREWGPVTSGFSLSIKARPEESLANEPIRLAIALRNETGADVRQTVEDWLRFFHLDLKDSEGRPVEPSPFGRRVLGVNEALRTVVFAADGPVEAELPVSDLFRLNLPGTYAASAWCIAPGSEPGAVCRSNRVTIVRHL